MSQIQPPPTWALPVDKQTGGYSPIWLKWFVDLAAAVNGTGNNAVSHNSTSGLQGGSVGPPTEYFHLSSAQHGLFTSGAANQVLHGSGTLPTWSAVALGTDVSGTLLAAQFPALTGKVTTSAGSLTTALNAAAADLTNGTTGTGTIVLAASPTLTGTVNFSGQTSTGANGATFAATNKPGSATTTVQTWLKISDGATSYYIPCWI